MSRYTVLIERDQDEGVYVVTVPALPGCVTQGNTFEQARERAREAISGHVAALRDLGQPVPVESDVVVATVEIDGLPSEFPLLKTLDAGSTNLPTPRTSFVGRDPELEEIERLRRRRPGYPPRPRRVRRMPLGERAGAPEALPHMRRRARARASSTPPRP